MVVDDSSAAPFTLLRFALAVLIALPYSSGLISSKKSSEACLAGDEIKMAWRWGAEMGVWIFLDLPFKRLVLR